MSKEHAEPIPDIPTRLRTGLYSGLQTSFKLLKFVLPLYIVVDLLKATPLVEHAGEFFAPMMHLFGLPGETAFAFIAAFTLNLYAGIAILVPLELSSWQITQCGLMMGIAHNLILEGGVLKSTGARAGILTLCRLLIAVICGLALTGAHWLWGA